MNRQRVLVWVAYATVCFIWGTSWLAIKIGLRDVPVLTSVGLRFLIAALFLFGAAALRRQLCPLSRAPWKLVCTLAVFLFGMNYVLIYLAETRLDSGLVAVLFGILPFFSFGFARWLLDERTSPRVWIGAVAALAGVAIVSGTHTIQAAPLFALAVIAAAASSSFANVYAKGHKHPPLVSLPPAMLIAGVSLLALALRFEHPQWHRVLSIPSIEALLYLAIAGSAIAFLLLLWLLERLPAGTVGFATLIFPVIALFVGALYGGEQTSTREIAGTAFVIAGLWVAHGNWNPAATLLRKIRYAYHGS